MLEQVSNLEAVKKAPFIVDSPKSVANPTAKSSVPESTPDFKSVLEKSLKAQAQAGGHSNPSASQNSPALKTGTQSAMPGASKTTPQATSKTNSALTGAGLDSGLSTIAPKPKDELASLLQESAREAQNPQSPNAAPSSEATNAPKKKTLNDMAKQEPQETFLSKITQNKLESAQNTPSTQNASSATPATPQSSIPSAKAGAPESKTPASMPNTEPKSTQGAGINASKALGGNARNSSDRELGDTQAGMPGAMSGLGASAIAQALAGEIAQSSQPNTPGITGAKELLGAEPGAKATPLAKSGAQDLGANTKGESKLAGVAASAAGAKTLGDVVQKAQDLGLNPSKAEFHQGGENSGQISGEEEFKNSLQARTGMRQAPASEGIKQFFDKQDEVSLRPFFSMLSAANALDAAARRSSKANRIEYAIESKTEKIAIINRGKILPKNITESRIKNERQEKVFEQIQKDIIAGKELDLEQIKAELFASNPIKDALTSPMPKPTLAKQALNTAAGASATIATQAGVAALVQEAKSQGNARRDSQGKSHENLKESIKENAKAKGESANTTANTTKLAQDPELAKTSQDLDLAEFSFDEQGFAPQEHTEQILEKTTTPKTSESAAKPEAKPESKLAAAGAGLGSSALKGESKPMVKEAIASFVSQFDQEIKKFKPPMNRLSMELSPKELGSIELTITQRGKNLQISVVSNPQALNLFAQNQFELRQNLIAQGFEGVDLSFTDSSGGSFSGGNREDNGRDNDRGGSDLTGEIGLDEIAQAPAQMNITLPLYA